MLIGVAAFRTFVPLRYQEERRMRAVGLVVETAVDVIAVVATGYWDSPFVFCLLTPVIAAGFAAGFAFAIATAASIAIAVGVPAVVEQGTGGEEPRLKLSVDQKADSLPGLTMTVHRSSRRSADRISAELEHACAT